MYSLFRRNIIVPISMSLFFFKLLFIVKQLYLSQFVYDEKDLHFNNKEKKNQLKIMKISIRS